LSDCLELGPPGSVEDERLDGVGASVGRRFVTYRLVATEAPDAVLQGKIDGVCSVVVPYRSVVWAMNESMAGVSTIAMAHPAKQHRS